MHRSQKKNDMFFLSGITQCYAAAVIWHVKHDYAGHMSS